MNGYDIYAIECAFWPWVSRRKAGDALRAMKRARDAEFLAVTGYAERVRERQCEKIAELEVKIRELEARAG